MLRRVAEHLYWFGRHIERAESMARLVSVTHHLLLDTDSASRLNWPTLIKLMGADSLYASLYPGRFDDDTVTRFLMVDERNPSSVAASLVYARENMRFAQDIIPAEAWEYVNRVYFYVREHGAQLAPGLAINDFVDDVIYGTRLVQGLLHSTLTECDDAYLFIDLGFNIERADMTTRIIDARAQTLDEPVAQELDPVLWMNLLKALSCAEIFRRQAQRPLDGAEVLRYLLKTDRFPRALRYCLNRLESHLSALPNSMPAVSACRRAAALVKDVDPRHLEQSGLSEFLDEVQRELIRINDLIAEAFFSD